MTFDLIEAGLALQAASRPSPNHAAACSAHEDDNEAYADELDGLTESTFQTKYLPMTGFNLCEAVNESSEADLNAMADAFNAGDDAELGRLIRERATEYWTECARDVAEAKIGKGW